MVLRLLALCKRLRRVGLARLSNKKPRRIAPAGLIASG
jgi:hypothetical protein